MTDNLNQFKKRIRPEWYENGPVKQFTREELDEWTATRYDEVWPKIASQQGLSEADIKFLDSLKTTQAELAYAEIMEGTSEGGSSES
jgi:hypothetical protein